jgi:hypothetical protein
VNKLIAKKLNEFLEYRMARFPKVSKKQKDQWAKSLEKEIVGYLDDNEIFYNTKPESVMEHLTGSY